MNIPMAIFFGVEGSIPLAFNQPNKATIIGVKKTTKKGFADWNISTAKSQFPILNLV